MSWTNPTGGSNSSKSNFMNGNKWHAPNVGTEKLIMIIPCSNGANYFNGVHPVHERFGQLQLPIRILATRYTDLSLSARHITTLPSDGSSVVSLAIGYWRIEDDGVLSASWNYFVKTIKQGSDCACIPNSRRTLPVCVLWYAIEDAPALGASARCNLAKRNVLWIYFYDRYYSWYTDSAVCVFRAFHSSKKNGVQKKREKIIEKKCTSLFFVMMRTMYNGSELYYELIFMQKGVKRTKRAIPTYPPFHLPNVALMILLKVDTKNPCKLLLFPISFQVYIFSNLHIRDDNQNDS